MPLSGRRGLQGQLQEDKGRQERGESLNGSAADGREIEDNPCYGYCRKQCGGPEADACVLDCVPRTSCTPH